MYMAWRDRYTFRPGGRVAVRTMVALAAGAELTLAYTSLAQPRARCGARTCSHSCCKHVLLHLLAVRCNYSLTNMCGHGACPCRFSTAQRHISYQ